MRSKSVYLFVSTKMCVSIRKYTTNMGSKSIQIYLSMYVDIKSTYDELQPKR